jgi:hypothetical protein
MRSGHCRHARLAWCKVRDSNSRSATRSTFTACVLCRSDNLAWCDRRDSNSYGLRRQALDLVRLPISPRSHWCAPTDSNRHARRHPLLRRTCLPVPCRRAWCRREDSNLQKSRGLNAPHLPGSATSAWCAHSDSNGEAPRFKRRRYTDSRHTRMAAQVGFEPTVVALTVRCTTAVLLSNGGGRGSRNLVAGLQDQSSTVELDPHVIRPGGVEPPLPGFVDRCLSAWPRACVGCSAIATAGGASACWPHRVPQSAGAVAM